MKLLNLVSLFTLFFIVSCGEQQESSLVSASELEESSAEFDANTIDFSDAEGFDKENFDLVVSRPDTYLGRLVALYRYGSWLVVYLRPATGVGPKESSRYFRFNLDLNKNTSLSKTLKEISPQRGGKLVDEKKLNLYIEVAAGGSYTSKYRSYKYLFRVTKAVKVATSGKDNDVNLDGSVNFKDFSVLKGLSFILGSRNILRPNVGSLFAQKVGTKITYTNLDLNKNGRYDGGDVIKIASKVKFSLSSDKKTVTDLRSGKTWTTVGGSGNFEAAKSYCSKLGNGYRLPTKDELLALAPNGNSAPFAKRTAWFWSSTENNRNRTQAVAVDLNKDNKFYTLSKKIYFAVRCVSNTKQTRFTNSTIVRDKYTGKSWQQSAGSGSFQKAVEYCRNLKVNNRSDFRLPTADELLELSPHGNDAPFQARTAWYWSSTRASSQGGRTRAVAVDLDKDGKKYTLSTSISFAVRCIAGN